MEVEKSGSRKTSYQKVGFELKLFVIDQIQNGQISINYASKKYGISRSSIHYWIDKYSRISQKETGMSKERELKKLKDKIEELEFIKEFQQDLIADLENITGADLSKKQLPESLSKEIAKKKADRSK